MLKIERIILNSRPINFVVEKSKHLILPGFQGVPLYDVVKFFRQQVRKIGLNERTAAISYNFIMAIPPACLFLFTLIPNLPFIPKRNIKHQLHLLIRDIIPSKEYNVGLIDFVDGFLDDPKIGLLSFGLILVLFFATNGMMGLMNAFDKEYYGFERRTGLQKRWTAIKLTLILMALLFACLILLILQGVVLRWMGIENVAVRDVINVVRWILLVTLIFLSIAFIYRNAPAIKKKWSFFSPGSILATTLSVLAMVAISAFVNNVARYNALYGSIGSIIVVTLLIYVNALILLIGYELNVSIHSLQMMAEERNRSQNIITKA